MQDWTVHGLLLTELGNFVVARYGHSKWQTIYRTAGIREDLASTEVYPDEVMMKLLKAASEATDMSVDLLLEEYGSWSLPAMFQLYAGAVDPAWRTLEFLENVTTIFHRGIVRTQAPSSTPPDLETDRTGDSELRLLYRSPRKMCALAKGFIRGAARQYGENVAIRELGCMRLGAPHCELRIAIL